MQSNKKYRIACYGFIDKNAGSLASANFLILEELLKRGHFVDLYAIKDFIEPKELEAYSNYSYVTFSEKDLRTLPMQISSRGWQFFEKARIKGFLYRIWGMLVAQVYQNVFARLAQSNHQHRSYDLAIFLGLPSFFRLKATPTISWLQGPFYTEGKLVRKLKKEIISLSGIWDYLTLRIFYLIRDSFSLLDIARSDEIICGSQWSKKMLLAAGIGSNRISVLPYPIDLHLFKPVDRSRKSSSSKIQLLWLGRIVPRKRLDLALEAIRLLVREGVDVHLQIIGDFAYSKKYKRLVEEFEFPEAISYIRLIERSKIPELMSNIDILLQPSEGENFGSAVAESLCYGIPVIVGSTNGTKDYINPSSFVFEEYSATSLKETIKTAIESIRTRRDEISREARSTAEKNFNVAHVVNQLEDVFYESTSQASPQRQTSRSLTVKRR